MLVKFDFQCLPNKQLKFFIVSLYSKRRRRNRFSLGTANPSDASAILNAHANKIALSVDGVDFEMIKHIKAVVQSSFPSKNIELIEFDVCTDVPFPTGQQALNAATDMGRRLSDGYSTAITVTFGDNYDDHFYKGFVVVCIYLRGIKYVMTAVTFEGALAVLLLQTV